MVFLWKKQKNIEAMIDQYFEGCDECFRLFDEAFDIYLAKGLGPEFDKAVKATHQAESQADDLRRDIELTLYGKALLPDSRGDMLGLLETFDRLPNEAETVLFALRSQRVRIPSEFHLAFRKLADINLESYRLLRQAVDALFNNPKATLHATKAVDLKESESDRQERDLISAIFDSGLEMGEKLLYKEIVLLIGAISDRAEGAADRIAIVAIKRQI
jgi:predicted phosphate transport protein (TIGR00153 family)